MWNDLPSEIIKALSLNCFKLLLDNLWNNKLLFIILILINTNSGQPIGDCSIRVYIDHYITSKNIMLVTFHYAVIVINTLACSKRH